MTNLSKAKGMIEGHLTPEDADALLRYTDSNRMANFRPFVQLTVNLADRLNVSEQGSPPPRPSRGPAITAGMTRLDTRD